MSQETKTQDQKFDAAIASEESKLALSELVQEAKTDKIVESVKVNIPANLFDNLDEL